MGGETEQFMIFDVRWGIPDTHGLQSDPLGLAPAPTGIRSAHVTCKPCAESWVAREGEKRGQFKSMMRGALWLSCPACGAEDVVRVNSLA